MDVGFCKSVVVDAIAKKDIPEIFNTDQGSQYTSKEFTNLLKDHEVKVWMVELEL